MRADACWSSPLAAKNRLALPGGEQRAFLEDGDEVILRGYCERKGLARIGFGECRAVVLPVVNGYVFLM